MLVEDSLLIFPGFQIGVAHEQGNFVVGVQVLPQAVGKIADGAGAGKAQRLTFKAGDGVAVVLVGADEVALSGHGLGVIKEIALHAVAVAVGRLEDAHLVAAVCVHHSGDAGGVVGAVRLKGAGAQGVGKALALAHQVVDGIGLVAVGHDVGTAQRQHRIVDDQAGVLQLCGVGCHGADAAALGHGVKHAVAAVLAAAHDEIIDAVLADQNATAGVGRIFQKVQKVDHFSSPLL